MRYLRSSVGLENIYSARRRALPALLLGLVGGIACLHRRTIADETRGQPHDLADFATKIEDIEASVRVTKYEPQELEKIGPDFKITYSVRTLTLQYKQPDKLRLEGKSPTRGNALLILNGPVRYYAIPKLRLHKTEDLSNAPGKRQSLLEYGGLLSPETLRFMEGRFVGQEKLGERAATVFELTYIKSGVGSHYRLWLDSRTHITLKRAWYDGDNKLRATFTYQDPKEVAPGVWLPGRAEIKNAEGVTAAEVSYTDVKINQKLPDSLFDTTQ
jgi:outer membrane lipoprotein-sorting protein